MRFPKIRSGFILFFLIGLLTSCSVKYNPVPTENIKVSDGYGILKQEDFVFAVSNKYWIKEPQNLTDYFTTFHISVKNKTIEKIEIKAEDISLLDNEGTQFDAVGTDYVLELLVPEEIAYNHYLEVPEEHRQIWENWREAKKHLMSDTFNFGSILPEATKSGFVFFPKLKSINKKCTVVFKGNMINFEREN